MTETGALIIGLHTERTGGFTGIAFLKPSTDLPQTTISLFVTDASLDVEGRLTGEAAPPAPEASPSDAVPSAVVVAVGDISCGQDSPHAPCRDDSVARLTASLNPDAVLPVGEIQYECVELVDYQNFFDHFWGSLKRILHPAAGHHEDQVDDEPDKPCFGLRPGAPGYWTYFGAAATPLDPECHLSCAGHYSFDLGSWHLIALRCRDRGL